MKKISLLFILLLPLNLFAETLYVGDTLRIGVRPEPSKNLPSISIIKTGASVEVLERNKSYAKVRTQSGVEGWVKSAYLTKNTPANNKLKIANNKIKTLEQKLTELKNSGDKTTSKAQADLQATIQQLQIEKNTMMKEIEALKINPVTNIETNNKMKQEFAGIDLAALNKDLLYIILGATFAVLILGFMVGVSWYKQQVTKRLGGLSI